MRPAETKRKQAKSQLDQDSRISRAVEDFKDKAFTSYAAASKFWNVGADAVRRRFLGIQASRSEARKQDLLLDKDQEAILVDWIRHRGMVARPADHAQIRAYAYKISGKKPGTNWPARFLARHADRLKFKKAAPLDPKRAHAFTEEVAQDNLKKLQDIIEEGNIAPKNIYNMDEKPLTLGGGRKRSGKKHAFAVEQKSTYRIQSDNLKMATVIETICADGTAPIPPGFVLPTGSAGDWEEVEGVGGLALTSNGWIDDGVGLGWFKDGFVPYAKARLDDPNDKILLIFDGHNSHKTDELINYAYEHGIYLYNLPPHTTHKLQPLDARIFAAVDRAWKNRCDERTTVGQPITMDTLVHEYMHIRPTAMQSSLILDAFRVTGIHPLTLSVFKPEDFAPSAATSASTHLPSTYPSLVPSSPVKLPDNYSYTDDDTDADYDPEIQSNYDVEVSAEERESLTEEVRGDSNSDREPTAPTQVEARPSADANDGLDSDTEFEEMDEDDAQEVDDNESGGSDGEGDEEMGIWNSRPENDDDAENDNDNDNDGNTDTPMRPINTSQSVDPVLVQRRPRFIRLPTAFQDPHSPATSYLTRSSSAMLFSPAPTTSSLPKPHFTSHQAKATKMQLKHELRTATTRLKFTEANLMAANAPCTVMAMENAELREQLELANAKKGRKGRGSKQALGVFLTPPARKEARRLEREKREADAAVAAEEQRQKEAAVQARRQQRLHNAIHQVFDKPLSSYQTVKKDELQDLAAALALDKIGTKAVVFARIEDHVKSHPELQQNDRFKALFGASRRGGGARRQP